MDNKLLPLGSVVSLYKNNTKLMIVGYLQKTEEDQNKVWDYSAVIYNNGFESPNRMIVFDSVQIENTYMLGYNNIESIEFLKEISKNIKEEVDIL